MIIVFYFQYLKNGLIGIKNNKRYFQIFLDVHINTLKKEILERFTQIKKDVVGVHIKYYKPFNNNITLKNDFKKKFLKSNI